MNALKTSQNVFCSVLGFLVGFGFFNKCMWVFISLGSTSIQRVKISVDQYSISKSKKDPEILFSWVCPVWQWTAFSKYKTIHLFKESPCLICAHCGSAIISVMYLHYQIFFFFFSPNQIFIYVPETIWLYAIIPVTGCSPRLNWASMGYNCTACHTLQEHTGWC